jgi:hypothetical protein
MNVFGQSKLSVEHRLCLVENDLKKLNEKSSSSSSGSGETLNYASGAGEMPTNKFIDGKRVYTQAFKGTIMTSDNPWRPAPDGSPQYNVVLIPSGVDMLVNAFGNCDFTTGTTLAIPIVTYTKHNGEMVTNTMALVFQTADSISLTVKDMWIPPEKSSYFVCVEYTKK